MIRPFIDTDLAAVYAIQLKCPQAAQWRQEDYWHLAHAPGGTILVAEIADAYPAAIVGFAAIHVVIDEAELRNIAVDPAHHRKGIARSLLTAGIDMVHKLGMRQLFLEVRASNQPAIAFYEAAGFQLLYRRRGYYHDPDEDALVMGRDARPALDASPLRTS